MFLGEQPGDQEDLQGEPFVGPAGALVLGPQFKLMQNHGRRSQVPSARRSSRRFTPRRCCARPDSDGRRAAYEMLVADLKIVERVVRHS